MNRGRDNMNFSLYMIAEIIFVKQERARWSEEEGRDLTMNEAMERWVSEGKAASFRESFNADNEAVMSQLSGEMHSMGVGVECVECMDMIIRRYIELFYERVLPNNSLRILCPKENKKVDDQKKKP
jgi:hypothetical protein